MKYKFIISYIELMNFWIITSLFYILYEVFARQHVYVEVGDSYTCHFIFMLDKCFSAFVVFVNILKEFR